MQQIRRLRVQYQYGLILFAVFTIAGIWVAHDYGISWDEFEQRQIGYGSYDYVLGHNPDFFKQDNSHGVAFELTLIFFEKAARLSDSGAIFYTRHIISHLFFLVGCLCGFVLIRRLTGSQLMAALGFLMLALMPRLYAHSFFNTKDIPFLSALLISFLFVQIAFQQRKIGWFLLAAVMLSYTTGIRVMGILPALVVLLFLLFDLVQSLDEKSDFKGCVRRLAVFIAGYLGALYGVWPYLWRHPFSAFFAAFSKLSYFAGAGGSTLFMGKSEPLNALPPSYIPVWMGITIPAVWLLTGLAGVLLLIIHFIKQPLTSLANVQQRNYLLFLACFLLPPVAVVLMHSIIYDDWRHLYFIYPSLVFSAIYFLDAVRRSKWGQLAMLLGAIQAAVTLADMFSNHPFEQVYFNRLVSHRSDYLRQNFELDYWGAGFKQGLEFLTRYDTSHYITINNLFVARAIKQNLILLSPADQQRIRFVEEEDHPKYLMTNFRYHPANYPYPMIYSRKVSGSTVLAIYRMQ